MLPYLKTDPGVLFSDKAFFEWDSVYCIFANMLIPPLARQHVVWLLLCCLPAITCQADTLTLHSLAQITPKIKLTPYLSVWEDPTQTSDTAIAHNNSSRFVPVNLLQQQSPLSFYWLRMPVRNDMGLVADMMLSFSNLTFVDVYLYQGQQCLLHKQAGAFRARSRLAPNDGRLYSLLPLQPGQTYELLLKVHHTKHYRPIFNFSLRQKDAFMHHLHRLQLIDAFSQGAVFLFLVYAILSWLVSRFRPYLWLLCYMTGIGLYGLATGGYLIEWFFPENPVMGWLFNVSFVHLGSFGIYMLLMDFWKMKQCNPVLYKVGQILIVELVILTITGLCIDYFTGNFNLANNINLCCFALPFSFIIASLWICWRRLTRAQRYMAYGLLLFFVAGAYIVLSSAILREKSLQTAPYISNFTTLAVFLLFATGLKEELRQHEIDKHAALAALNRLQQHQNAILEQKVETRTSELSISNRNLMEQKLLLANKHTKIETLINELNHRVKNNLQLLYSLSSLQVPVVSDEASREILRGNMGKIKAMMLVNEKLFRFEEQSTVRVSEFTRELTDHLQRIYDSKRRIHIVQDVSSSIQLQGKQALSFGLILTELLTNSFKYAFTDHHTPAINIAVASADDHSIQFLYADNGKGMEHAEPEKKTTMGVSLIHDLTRQMNGKITVKNGQGLTYQLLIPV